MPAYKWISLFYLCYNWIYDGGQYNKNKKIYRTGYYIIRDWPSKGNVMDQSQIIVDILHIIKIEEAKING